MRTDIPAKVVIASCLVGLGMIAFRSIRLVGVCLVLADGRIRRGRKRRDLLKKV